MKISEVDTIPEAYTDALRCALLLDDKEAAVAVSKRAARHFDDPRPFAVPAVEAAARNRDVDQLRHLVPLIEGIPEHAEGVLYLTVVEAIVEGRFGDADRGAAQLPDNHTAATLRAFLLQGTHQYTAAFELQKRFAQEAPYPSEPGTYVFSGHTDELLQIERERFERGGEPTVEYLLPAMVADASDDLAQLTDAFDESDACQSFPSLVFAMMNSGRDEEVLARFATKVARTSEKRQQDCMGHISTAALFFVGTHDFDEVAAILPLASSLKDELLQRLRRYTCPPTHIKQLRGDLVADPDDLARQKELANCLNRLGKFEDASTILLKPGNDPDRLDSFGVAQLGLGNGNKAAVIFGDLARRHPHSTRAATLLFAARLRSSTPPPRDEAIRESQRLARWFSVKLPGALASAMLIDALSDAGHTDLVSPICQAQQTALYPIEAPETRLLASKCPDYLQQRKERWGVGYDEDLAPENIQP